MNRLWSSRINCNKDDFNEVPSSILMNIFHRKNIDLFTIEKHLYRTQLICIQIRYVIAR